MNRRVRIDAILLLPLLDPPFNQHDLGGQTPVEPLLGGLARVVLLDVDLSEACLEHGKVGDEELIRYRARLLGRAELKVRDVAIVVPSIENLLILLEVDRFVGQHGRCEVDIV